MVSTIINSRGIQKYHFLIHENARFGSARSRVLLAMFSIPCVRIDVPPHDRRFIFHGVIHFQAKNKVSLFLSFLLNYFATVSGSFQPFSSWKLGSIACLQVLVSFPTTPLFVHERGRTRLHYLSTPSFNSFHIGHVGVCMVISWPLVNFILDHATKHRHFIVSNFRKTFHLFWNMGIFQHYQYSRLPLLNVLHTKDRRGWGKGCPPPPPLPRWGLFGNFGTNTGF